MPSKGITLEMKPCAVVGMQMACKADRMPSRMGVQITSQADRMLINVEYAWRMYKKPLAGMTYVTGGVTSTRTVTSWSHLEPVGAGSLGWGQVVPVEDQVEERGDHIHGPGGSFFDPGAHTNFYRGGTGIWRRDLLRKPPRAN